MGAQDPASPPAGSEGGGQGSSAPLWGPTQCAEPQRGRRGGESDPGFEFIRAWEAGPNGAPAPRADRSSPGGTPSGAFSAHFYGWVRPPVPVEIVEYNIVSRLTIYGSGGRVGYFAVWPTPVPRQSPGQARFAARGRVGAFPPRCAGEAPRLASLFLGRWPPVLAQPRRMCFTLARAGPCASPLGLSFKKKRGRGLARSRPRWGGSLVPIPGSARAPPPQGSPHRPHPGRGRHEKKDHYKF